MAVSPPQPAILLEDDHLLAVVKPAGLPTANAARGMPSVFTILSGSRPAGAFLGVVSRLDAPVSGVLVMAKTRAAAADLSRQFRERLVEKTYEAVVEGRFPAPLGQWVDWHDRIERLGEERRSRLLSTGAAPRAVPPDEVDDGDDDEMAAGDACHVRARVVKRLGEVSLVELAPSTGRRHQLRAQLAARGCAIVGDRVYGARLPFPSTHPSLPPSHTPSLQGGGAAIALHACSLRLDHPATRQPVILTAPWPAAWTTRFPSLARGPNTPRGGDRSQSGGVD